MACRLFFSPKGNEQRPFHESVGLEYNQALVNEFFSTFLFFGVACVCILLGGKIVGLGKKKL